MANTRTYITFAELQDEHPDAAQALEDKFEGDMSYALNESDLVIYAYEGEFYTESHDEYTLHVWRNGLWSELDFENRPPI
jgi:hypothetical protein